MKTDSLIGDLAKEVTPVKRVLHPFLRALFCVTLALIFVSASVYFLGIRHDMESAMSSETFVLEMLSALVTGLLAAVAANWLAIPDVRQQKWVTWLPFFPLSFFIFMAVYQYILQPVHLSDVDVGAVCMLDVVWLISIPAVIIFILLKKAATTHTKMASFMAILSVLAFGYLCARLVCPNDDLMHLMLWHYAPVFLIGIVGAAVGRKILQW